MAEKKMEVVHMNGGGWEILVKSWSVDRKCGEIGITLLLSRVKIKYSKLHEGRADALSEDLLAGYSMPTSFI